MKLYLLLMLTMISTTALGAASEEEAEDHSGPVKVLLSQTYSLKDNRGRLHILVQSDGHSNGRGLVLELRPDCRKRTRPWQQLEVRDTESQCYLDIQTLKFDANQETVSIEGYEMDYELYEKNMQKDPPETATTCDFKTKKTFILKTNGFCQKKVSR